MIAKYELDKGKDPQSYGIGIKELWEIDPKHHKPGLVVHTTGWPMMDQYAGSFLYHLENNQVAVGYVFGFPTRQPRIQHSHRLAVLPVMLPLRSETPATPTLRVPRSKWPPSTTSVEVAAST